MGTKVQCGCGAVVDLSVALPGERVECPGCGGVVADAVSIELPPGMLAAYGEAEGGRVVTEEEEVVARLVPAAPPAPPEHLARAGGVVVQAGVGVEWWHYFRGFPAAVAVCVVLVAIAGVGAVLVHPLYAAVGLIGVAYLVADVLEVRRRFGAGHACAGVVVSRERSLVAVLDDLRVVGVGGEERPAVRVMWQPLGRLVGGVPEVGTRVVAVAAYEGPVRGGRWADFVPTVVRCGTRDEVECGRVEAMVGEGDWRRVEEMVGAREAWRVGMYSLWDGGRAGRRRGWYLRVVNGVAGLVLVAAVVGPLVLVKKGVEVEDRRGLAPGSVPGRIHYDWNR